MKALSEHPRHLLLCSAIAGLMLCRLPQEALLVAAAATAILLCCLQPAHVALGGAALVLLFGGIGSARLAAIDADPLAGVAKGEFTGYAVGLPQESGFGTSRIRIKLTEIDGVAIAQQVELRTRADIAAARIGRQLRFSGRVSLVSVEAAANESARRAAEALLRSGVRRRVQADAAQLTGQRRGGATGLVDRIRDRSDAAIATGLGAESAALLRGMVLGGDHGIPEPTVEAFRVAGLSHVLAVSGQNVLLIVILLQAGLVAAGAGWRTRLLVPALAICIYVPLCGMQASVMRAGVMGLAALAAIAASRPASRLYALLLAALLLLIWNPRIHADVGAQLSFAAVLGIMAFTQPLADRLDRLPRWMAEAFAATAGATLATAPLMAFHFGAVSLVSLAVNVLATPLIAPIVWIGSLTAALGQFSLPLAALLGAPNEFLVGALIELARASTRVPHAQLSLTIGTTALALSAAMIALLALLAQRPRRRSRGGRGRWIVLLLAFAAVALLTPPGSRMQRPAIAMLDVGQGDALLIRGSDDCDVLIDAGPPGGRLAAKLRRAGVDDLDLAVITHAQNDHYGGFNEIDIPVARLFDGIGNVVDAGALEARQKLAKAGAVIEPAAAGSRWQCGDVAVQVIGPAPEPPGAPPPSDPNTRALVTLIDVAGVRVFASGDAESPQLLGLPLTEVDVLKLPHHGSNDPGLPALLARLRPRTALIGVGAQNRFGHPTPATLGALAAAGVKVGRTDTDGDVVVAP